MRERRGQSVAVCALLIVTGCRVGPNYRSPAPPVGATGALVTVDSHVDAVTDVPAEWWKLFDDARLDAYVAEALTANADLAAARANLLSARAVVDAAQSGRYPQTELTASALYGRDAATDEILELQSAPPKTTWLFENVFEVAYEVDLWGRVSRSIEASRADAAVAAAARDSLRVIVVAETSRAYADICALGEEITVARRSLDVVTRESRITSDRHAAGANSNFDVVRAQGVVAQVQATIPPIEGQRRAALFELGALLGRTPAHAPVEANDCHAPSPLANSLPVGNGATLLKRRPDIRRADYQLAAATARIGIATADLYPKIALSGLGGGVAFNGGDLTSSAGLTWGVGPSISWTFPNQALPRARVRQAKAAAAAALANFDSIVLIALKETEQSLVTYASQLERHASLAEAQRKAQEGFYLANDRFSAGSLSTLELLIAEQSLVAADGALAASNTSIIQSQIAVFKALGGGWQSVGTEHAAADQRTD